MPFGGLLTAGIGAAGSLFGGLFGANASGEASKEYIDALKQAQGSLQDSQKQALGNLDPYLTAGKSATGTLSDMLSTPGKGLLQNWTNTFQAPTAEEAAKTPGYQFQLKAGQDAIQNSAAAKGGLLSGGTLADLNNYSQGIASENYQNTFSNALSQYQNAYQSFLNNQNNTYNRLAGMSGQGLNASSTAGNIITGIGGDIASLYGQEGAAKAQGTIGQANSLGSIFPGISSSFMNYGLLKNMNGGGGGGGSAVPTSTGLGDGVPFS